ncbi:MAG TPA: SRPBCC domain-containing protein [Rhizomicrobium sp.]|nr:SRPBCC domain-containing protein [Rhizomicrobium sp.]
MRNIIIGTAIAAALALPQVCHAAVNDAADNGFSVTETVHIAAAPDKVYGTLVTPSRWWSPVHTFSKSAANISLEARAGGCWCETLSNGGSVQHLTVVFASPGQALVMRGPLGPLQGLGVDGALTIELKAAGGGTDLTATYNVGGYLKDGLTSWAQPVDGVLGEQFNRLKAAIETGSPDSKAASKKEH